MLRRACPSAAWESAVYAEHMDDERRCSGCEGELRLGFLEDKGERGSIGASRVLSWIEGRAEKGAFGGAKVLGKTRRDVQAYRCDRCGHLDLYVD